MKIKVSFKELIIYIYFETDKTIFFILTQLTKSKVIQYLNQLI